MNFDYRISVIIPVYNADKYLRDCLDSLVVQTIDKNEIEVLLIDDGSSDDSASICDEYCDKYSFFKCFHRQNSGVSKTRNVAIDIAKGKYFLYLDSDDTLSKETLKNIADYFDEVYDEVDLMTYLIQPHKDGNLLKVHGRYDFLIDTGVYDLEEYPYIVQGTMNICVKNLGENNHYFNVNMKFQEDQEYINRVLMDKMKIAYCKDACYFYNRNNEQSAVSNKFHAFYIFESSTKYFEELFSLFENRVPKYFQALFFHDLRWKLSSKILYPFHYSKNDFNIAINRIKALLERVDSDIICNYPWASLKHIYYWLSMKPNVNPIPYIDKGSLSVVVEGQTYKKKKNSLVIISKFEQIENGLISVRGRIEDGVYNFLDELPELYIVENGINAKKVDLFESKFCYAGTNIKTNKVYGFNYIIDPKEISCISFYTVIDGFKFDSKLTFGNKAVFNLERNVNSYARGNCKISYCVNDDIESVSFEVLSKEEIYDFEKEQNKLNEYLNPNFDENDIRELKDKAIDYRFHHKVWLYSDLSTVQKDNGYYQFMNDFGKEDGVERYYVYTRPLKEISHLFDEKQKDFLVEFGSDKHKLLYLSASCIISSFFGRDTISPFSTEGEEINYYSIQHFKIIYMQHGVLHASFVEKYSAESTQCDKVVVSSYFEIQNLVKKYAYREEALIKSGMPRYEYIDRTAKAKGRILLAPSWRSYLAKTVTANNYCINNFSFINSDYYININNFLKDEKLQKCLEENNVYLDVKMHPIVNNLVSDLFDIDCKFIKFVSGDVNLSDYNAFVTDFSSYVFDFAYLSRPVMYFVPDYQQFLSGMNLYRHLDLDFKDAFGPMSDNYEEAVNNLIEIIENKFIPEDIYKKRMDEFYLPIEDNCRETIYKEIYEFTD